MPWTRDHGTGHPGLHTVLTVRDGAGTEITLDEITTTMATTKTSASAVPALLTTALRPLLTRGPDLPVRLFPSGSSRLTVKAVIRDKLREPHQR